MNVNDASSAQSIFESHGLIKTDNKEDADIIMISTCCVREKAELKVYSYIGSLKKLKNLNEDLIIIVSGCMSEQEDVRENLFKIFPFLDIVIGTCKLNVLMQYLHKRIETNTKVNYAFDTTGEKLPLRKSERVSEFVTIMTGCDNYCSYCIVPFVRGREKSRDVQEIINEINHMTKYGCKEVTLLGQNVNSYGLDNGKVSFAKLLKIVNEDTDVVRIRFLTSHPKDITNDILELMSEDNKICNHLHLPLQSGSDNILQKMNRQYNISHYLNIIDKAKNNINDIEFTTDIIVGFPGETDDDFERTLEIMKEIEFASAYMFKYSIRKNTPASEYENRIEETIKSERLSRLMAVEAQIKKNIYASYIGTSQSILVENKSMDGKNYAGKTTSGITVNYKGDNKDIGNIVEVEITKAKTNTLYGEYGGLYELQ